MSPDGRRVALPLAAVIAAAAGDDVQAGRAPSDRRECRRTLLGAAP